MRQQNYESGREQGERGGGGRERERGRARGKGKIGRQRVAKEDGGNRAGQSGKGGEVGKIEGWTEGEEGEKVVVGDSERKKEGGDQSEKLSGTREIKHGEHGEEEG